MSQGLAWKEDLPCSDPANSEIQMGHGADPVGYAPAQPVEEPPGLVYNHGGGSATIIAALVHKAAGRTLDALAHGALFEPRGITDDEWVRFPFGQARCRAGGDGVLAVSRAA